MTKFKIDCALEQCLDLANVILIYEEIVFPSKNGTWSFQ